MKTHHFTYLRAEIHRHEYQDLHLLRPPWQTPWGEWDQFKDFSVLPQEPHPILILCLPSQDCCFLPISKRPWEVGKEEGTIPLFRSS